MFKTFFRMINLDDGDGSGGHSRNLPYSWGCINWFGGRKPALGLLINLTTPIDFSQKIICLEYNFKMDKREFKISFEFWVNKL